MLVRRPPELLSCTVALLALGLLAAVFPPPVAGWPHAVPPAVVASSPAPPLVPARPEVLSQVARAGSSPVRTVALTFDDGPDPSWTPAVLDVLARHHAVATFCVVGTNADRHPDLVRRIVGAGMRLCDHTQSHDERLAGRPADVIAREVVDMRTGLASRSGAPVGYFRAPGGNWSPALLDAAAGHGMQPLGWNVDPRDWRRPGVAEIVRRVQAGMRPGAVVLLHDGGGRRDQTVAALEQLLPWLVANCYAFSFPTAELPAPP